MTEGARRMTVEEAYLARQRARDAGTSEAGPPEPECGAPPVVPSARGVASARAPSKITVSGPAAVPHAVPRPEPTILPSSRRPPLPPGPPPRPRVEDDLSILGLSRHSRSRVGSRVFTLVFVFVFALIVVQMVVALLAS